MAVMKSFVHQLLSDISTLGGTDHLYFSLCMGLLVLYILQAASSVSVKRRYRKQRQLLAKLTAENVELRLKLGQREQQHAETVKRLKHEQSVVLRKVQELEGVLEKL